MAQSSLNQKKLFANWTIAGISLLIVAVLLLGITHPALARPHADTYVSGSITTNTTWTLAGSPYILMGDLSINSGVSLTIDAGVQVRANGMVGITVNGTLNATGNSGAHVVFTSNAVSPAPGDWQGIYVANGGAANLDYTEIRYGGGFFWWGQTASEGNHFGDIRKDAAGTVTINHSLITQSAACGLRFDGSSGVNSIANTTLSDNQGYGACLNGSTANTITFTSSAFTGNLPQAIITTPHSSGFSIDPSNTLDKPIYVRAGAVDVDSTWSPQVYLLDDVNVSAARTLAIPEGTVVKFNGMTGMEIQGTLSTTGNSGEHVVFTSNAVSPASGDWKGIYIAEGGVANLDYTEIRYGGGYFWWGQTATSGNHFGDIRKDGSGTLTVNHSLITQSGGVGINLFVDHGTVTISDSTIENNAEWGLYNNSSTLSLLVEKSMIDHNGAGILTATSNGTPQFFSNTIVANSGPGIQIISGTLAIVGGSDVHGNNIYGNNGYQIQNQNAVTLDASHNWWGINPPTPSIYGSVDITFPLSGPAANAPAYLADAAISATSMPTTGLTGQPMDYVLSITNNGPREAYYLKVSAVLPDGVDLSNFVGSGWTCTQGGQQLSCVITNLEPAGVSGLTVTLTAASPVHMQFDFLLGAANNDTVPANNLLAVDTQVNTQVFIPMVSR